MQLVPRIKGSTKIMCAKCGQACILYYLQRETLELVISQKDISFF